MDALIKTSETISDQWKDYIKNNPQHQEGILDLLNRKMESNLRMHNIPELKSSDLSPFGNYLVSLLVNEIKTSSLN